MHIKEIEQMNLRELVELHSMRTMQYNDFKSQLKFIESQINEINTHLEKFQNAYNDRPVPYKLVNTTSKEEECDDYLEQFEENLSSAELPKVANPPKRERLKWEDGLKKLKDVPSPAKNNVSYLKVDREGRTIDIDTEIKNVLFTDNKFINPKILKILYDNDVYFMDQLVIRTEADLLMMPRMGVLYLDLIKELLEQNKLKLGMTDDEIFSKVEER